MNKNVGWIASTLLALVGLNQHSVILSEVAVRNADSNTVKGSAFPLRMTELESPKIRGWKLEAYFTPLVASHEPCSLRTITISPM
jgi:hypothetical protein